MTHSLRNWLMALSIIGVVYIAMKIYIEKTIDPTFKIGANSIQWKDQYYEHDNLEKDEVGSFICRTSDGHKLYAIKGDTIHHSVIVLFPGIAGRYQKYSKR